MHLLGAEFPKTILVQSKILDADLMLKDNELKFLKKYVILFYEKRIKALPSMWIHH